MLGGDGIVEPSPPPRTLLWQDPLGKVLIHLTKPERTLFIARQFTGEPGSTDGTGECVRLQAKHLGDSDHHDQQGVIYINLGSKNN
jgi:hypothetical protein